MKITVICPTYNEEKHVGNVIDFCEGALPYDKEVIFMDGASTDNTVKIIEERQAKNPGIILLHNPKRFVPFALNSAIKIAKSDIIVRIDAHTLYAKDYFEKILEVFQESGADIVGGPMSTTHNNALQEAVAYAMCTPFGIGDSKIHQMDYEGPTDSVTYGAWKKSIFEKTGLFDEVFKRNQDDEFHYRAKSLGFKIYQSPKIKMSYFPRDTFKGLFKQYYGYGLYKPLVLKKIKSGLSIRHLIPALFVIYLFSLPVAAVFGYFFWFLFIGLYVALDLFFCIKSRKSIRVQALIFLVYPIFHFAYGSGFILGLFKKRSL